MSEEKPESRYLIKVVGFIFLYGLLAIIGLIFSGPAFWPIFFTWGVLFGLGFALLFRYRKIE